MTAQSDLTMLGERLELSVCEHVALFTGGHSIGVFLLQLNLKNLLHSLFIEKIARKYLND
jgi:hypothetical protein